ncbi:MAG TPA: [protein-PII] uridylyltransferase [Methylomirabilota bacterium]|nr:[protein-PII] uridylyltransferase [Methylomirabilota bacterium]
MNRESLTFAPHTAESLAFGLNSDITYSAVGVYLPMPNLLAEIESDAREKLALPPNREPRQEIKRYKDFLNAQNTRLMEVHRSRAKGGLEVARARAAVLDLLLRSILSDVQKFVPTPGHSVPKFALVAIGGYGRGELNPHSDIDIMFLHERDQATAGKPSPWLAALADGLLYTLWDIGLKVGHSVRNIDDCVRTANSDMQSKTSLIEARLVAGDKALFDNMNAAVITKCVRGFEKAYLQSRIEDQATRRAKYGNSACMQEPNIKNGCGGMRDYQNLIWMAYFKYRTRTLKELEAKELITEDELTELDDAYEFLFWVRNELHYQAGRPVDVLTRNLQASIAYQLGYMDRSPIQRVQKFMRELYNHMRNIYLITRILEERLALLPERTRFPTLRALWQKGRAIGGEKTVDGFKISKGQIHWANPRVFKDQPRRFMRVFLYAQQHGASLHPDLAQVIRNEAPKIPNEVWRDQHVHTSFMEILNARGNVAPTLHAMHDVGLLGRYMPEFGKLTCLVQHEFYHQYAADEHTLKCIEKLDQVWDANEQPFSRYTELFQNLERPNVLYLAMLLHDVGKAAPEEDHTELGGEIAIKVARRMELDGATTHTLRLIIENHLAMAQISQRRDLDDPAVIRNFASLIQSPENLVMLTLHTLADSLGTSDQLWNGFKDTLLRALYEKTMALFKGPEGYAAAEEKQFELLKEQVASILPPTFSLEEIEAHFENLPPRYFHIHSARQIASDLTMAHRFMHLQLDEEDKALEPVVLWHNENDRGYSSVHICTWDRAGLFHKVAGSLTAAGMNILSAQIFTRADGMVLDTFFVTDARSGGLAKKEEKEKFESLLKEALIDEIDLTPLIARQKRLNRLYQSFEGERIPTSLRFDNETSEESTIIDIECEDQVGLLYAISKIFHELDLDIELARITTEKGAAIDTFYVKHRDYGKILNPEHQQYLRERLLEAVGQWEALATPSKRG